MGRATAIWQQFRGAALPALCLLLIGYFVSHAIAGPTGVVAWRGYEAERVALEHKAAASRETKAALERQVALLDPRRVDPDLADELVRRNLNMVRPDEVIVPLTAPADPAR